MLFSLYRSLTFLGEPLIRAYLRHRLAKGREDRARFSERLGVPSRPRPAGRLVWCHGASVGEAASMLQLIERMHEHQPDLSFLVTTGTVTSARMLETRLPPYAFHQYVPVDLAKNVRRFLDHWKPTLALWIESELWPNLLGAVKERQIPAVLLNARMSERSFKNWRWAKTAIKELLSCFSSCLAQTEKDGERFAALGAKDVRCCGNLKYVSAPLPFDSDELAVMQKATLGRPVWLMASTHPGEEAMALEAHRELAKQKPEILTILAPRHPARGEAIARLIEEAGLRVARRSLREAVKPETQVYLADTLGEMGLFFAWSPVTVLGGSFVDIGGHNPIEPAQRGSAIVFGPLMYNFSEIEKAFLERGAAQKIMGADAIAPTVAALLDKKEERDKQIKAARLLAEEKRSILDQIVLDIAPWLK